MFGNDKAGLAAAMAGGLIVLAALAGCGGASVAGKSVAAFEEAGASAGHHEGAPPGHDHGVEAPGAADHSAMSHGDEHHAAGHLTERSESAATAVPPGQPAQTLRPDALDAPAPTSVTDAQRSAEMAEEMTGASHGGHGGTYRHVDAGRGPGAHQGPEEQTPGAGPHHDHGSAMPAPSQQEEHSHEPPASGARAGGAADEEAAVYACPMHPEVTSGTPGECPKCGMTLVERRKE